MAKRTIQFVFEDDSAAKGFLTWLSDAGGDQDYWRALEESAKYPTVRFNYRHVYPMPNNVPEGEPWVVLCPSQPKDEDE